MHIGILPYCVLLVCTHTFDIYVCHDIMQTFPFLWRLATCNALCPTKPGLGVRIQAYLVVPCAHVRAVCGEVPHIQPYSKLEKVQGHVTALKDKSQLRYVCDCIINPNNRVTC